MRLLLTLLAAALLTACNGKPPPRLTDAQAAAFFQWGNCPAAHQYRCLALKE